MPIILTFDLSKAVPPDHGRLQSMFQRLGWEHLGGTAYRYPRMDVQQDEHPIEDWFNQVAPALMLFRAYVMQASTRGITLTKFTLDSQTSTGFHAQNGFGNPPAVAVGPMTAQNRDFAARTLRNWINDIRWPYNAEGVIG